MKNILGFAAVAAASAPFRKISLSVSHLGHDGLPDFLTSKPDCDNQTWTDHSAGPSDGLPSSRHPSITTSIFPSVVHHHPPSTVTATQSGAVSISTIFLTSIVTWVEMRTHTLPVSKNITITVERTIPAPTTVYQTTTTTRTPSPACLSSGAFATSNAAVCQGQGCEITFEKGAVIHWEPLITRTPLVTHYLRSSCVAVVCNTTEFSLYYSRSATSCDRPPCPSNSLNCECNIVVGPIRLPDGRITSVTQTGPSGWELNLGPTATAHNIGYCGPNGPVCDAITTTLFTPLIYTDEVQVVSATAWRNDTKPEATEFLLPQLTDYLPSNDPLGMCTDIKLFIPSTATASFRKRGDVATVGGDGVTTWPGADTLTAVANAKRGLVARQTTSPDVVPLPICSSDQIVSTTTVTATFRETGINTAVEAQTSSSATGPNLHFGWYVLLLLLLIVATRSL